jgi:hypothetical protein
MICQGLLGVCCAIDRSMHIPTAHQAILKYSLIEQDIVSCIIAPSICPIN